jgi:hypothetical protein
MITETDYIYSFAKLFDDSSLNETSNSASNEASSTVFKPFIINRWFIYHSCDGYEMASMVRDTPFTVPIKNGQKFRYQLLRLKKNKDLLLNDQVFDYNQKVTEIIESKYITSTLVHSKGFEILADFIYTVDEVNPILNYQGFEIQFKYCIIPGLKDTDSDEETQLYMTHPNFKWKKSLI